MGSSTPRNVHMHGAVEAIRALAKPRPESAAAVVGITGPVGAGKSTLASRLTTCVIPTDMYLPDYNRVPYERRDLPEESDLARLADDLARLREGRATKIPIWSFKEHKRVGEVEVAPAVLVAVEGLHALHDVHAHALDVRVFVDAPATTRWKRWEHLEATGQRGWGVEVAREFFNQVAEPTFARYAPAYRGGSHVIVVNDGALPD